MQRTHLCPWLVTLSMLGGAATALAHHSYSMFDVSRELTVSGVVAKFEWKNPHTYVWVYVPSSARAGTYELWAFENASPSLLAKLGWGKESLRPNDNVTVTYAPLRDGKPGGHCLKITLSGGRSLECVGFGSGPAAAAR